MFLTHQRPLRLFRTSIPFVYPSSGSIGNNGALSGITALPQAYPVAYVYVKADAIVAGSAAGWYYAVFASTTAATLYNNVYTSGVPAIPTTPTAFATTGPGAYTQTTGSNITGPTFTMPANTFGPEGRLRVEMASRATASNANAKQINFAIGSTTMFSQSLASSTGTEVVGRMKGQAATGRQTVALGTALVATDVTNDTTTDLTCNLRFNLGTASDGLILNCCDVVLEA